MIPIEKLRALKTAYVHANCPDGVASALVLKDALPDLDIRFVKYGTAEHREIEPTPNTIFCDFSPWLPDLKEHFGDEREELIKKWNDAGVVVLDHHDRAIVEPYPFGVFGENDKLECGAMLAYREVWEPLRLSYVTHSHKYHTMVEHFARLAAIRDTWQKNNPDWDAANKQASILMFFRFEQLSLDLLEDLQEGPLAPRLFERQIELAETCIKEAFVFRSEKGTKVLMFQGVSATSDAAELCDNRPELVPNLVVGFHYRADDGKLQLQFSTRSHTGFDCQAFAQAHGGNGHKAAAGFTFRASENSANPYVVFRLLLDEWE